MVTIVVETVPFFNPLPCPSPSMYNLRLNCSVGSTILSAIIGILAVAVVAPLVKVAVYRPAVKSAPAISRQISEKIYNRTICTLLAIISYAQT